eukprot:3404715-Rhodomonas_salina.1
MSGVGRGRGSLRAVGFASTWRASARVGRYAGPGGRGLAAAGDRGGSPTVLVGRRDLGGAGGGRDQDQRS